PSTRGPHEPTKSTYSFPSTSHTRAPCPRAMNRGVPPTAPKERTGLFTPPGISFWERANRASERERSIESTSLRRNRASSHGEPHFEGDRVLQGRAVAGEVSHERPALAIDGKALVEWLL